MGQEFLLGNEAIALGLAEAGCEVVTAYPGTPSTEVLESLIRLDRRDRLGLYTEWSVNEKIALDVAFAAAMVGKRAASVMKQVGLNVASDSLLSAVYTGVTGGFVVVSCDDPGPYSSQTEQDSRLFALFAKIPTLDPATPREARTLARLAVELSERHRIPVLLRPTIRVCHARQTVDVGPVASARRPGKFLRDTSRWAATPPFRLKLHHELNQKLAAIREEFETFPGNAVEEGEGDLGIIACGAAWGVVTDALSEMGAHPPVLKLATAYPAPLGLVGRFVARCRRVLVLEEPDAAVESQIPDRRKVLGRLTGDVPGAGELSADLVTELLGRYLGKPAPPVSSPIPSANRPRLCPGCGHRAAFYAIRKAFPSAIYPSDIGCYTLGINQKAVDTVLDMGASISLATGFWHALGRDGAAPPIVATIGDSTFFHSGQTALLNAHVTGARFVLVILDNGIVAMTGFQPTPAAGIRGDGTPAPVADIARIVAGIGIRFVETIDPYDIPGTMALLKRAGAHARAPDGGVAVVIARRACALHTPPQPRIPVEILPDLCTACDHCLKFCECPALVKDAGTGKVRIEHAVCNDCGFCVHTCPTDAIVQTGVPVPP